MINHENTYCLSSEITADYVFEKARKEFVLANCKRPTDCVISAWPVDRLAANSDKLMLHDDGTVTYRGIRLIPSDGDKNLYFFIKL